MAKTKYSHAFLVGSFNGEIKPDQLDNKVWKQEIISPNGDKPRYSKDRGYNGLCSLFYKAHLDAMLETQEEEHRPEFLNSVHHYIHYLNERGEGCEVELSVKKGKYREISFIYKFKLCKLHLFFFPLDIVLFAIEIDDSGTELDDLTAAHNYLMTCWDTNSFNNRYLAKLMMPLMAYLITNNTVRLTKDGNKLKLFQTIKIDEQLLSDELLYELASSSPIGCIKGVNRPEMKPSEDYFNKILSENSVSTFDNWKGLALVDSFTILGKDDSFNEDDCNYLYFPLIYLRCILEKTFCFSRNNAYREDKIRKESPLELEIENMEKYYFYDSISYNFQPSLLYQVMAKGLDVKKEREELAKQIKERAHKEAEYKKEKEGKRFNHILSWATVFVIFSVAWDLCSIIKEAFVISDDCNKSKTAWLFLIIGSIIVITLIYKIFRNHIFEKMRIMSRKIALFLKKEPCIKIPEDNLSHLSTHFQQDLPGSKFYCESPEVLLEKAMRMFPQVFREARPDDDGRFRISLTFPDEIGVSNVVNIKELTDEEKKRIEIIDRNGKMVRSVKTDRIIPTHDCQIILSSDWHLITMFPGEMAPPLPDSPDIHDEYWDNHVFIVTTK